MGLVQEVQALNREYIQAKKDAEKATREAERLAKKLEHEKEQKQAKKDLTIATKNDLRGYFEEYIEQHGLDDSIINLNLKTKRDEIIQEIGQTTTECNYLYDNYDKLLKQTIQVYENDEKAKMQIYLKVFEKILKEHGTYNLALQIGYKPNKLYTIGELDILNNKLQQKIKEIKQQNELIEKQKEEQKAELYTTLVNLFFLFVNPITIILYLLIWGYFKFAIPILNS